MGGFLSFSFVKHTRSPRVVTPPALRFYAAFLFFISAWSLAGQYVHKGAGAGSGTLARKALASFRPALEVHARRGRRRQIRTLLYS